METKETNFFLSDSLEKKQAIGVIHRVYLSQLKNSRKYLASTKTKSEIRGGGRKPWRQKGTGRARAGSTRSPLFVGGGVIFGPKPRTVFKKINKQEKKLATFLSLFLKIREFKFFDEKELENFSEIKTKKVCKILSNLGVISEKKILFVLAKPNKNFWLSARNLKNIEITTASCMNIEQILKANSILLSRECFELIKLSYFDLMKINLPYTKKND
jgi:large subunit ribosomal protein L4|uniref:Large ribosomal subunit protein uL4c n=1 Tax=Synura petersenii TaxID=52555 RepID=A0A3G2QYG7_9STRA|nr:ribosomal protein L4 [Synura petersenii]